MVIKSRTALCGDGTNNVAHELEWQHRERRFRRVEMGEQNQRSTVHHLFLRKHVSSDEYHPTGHARISCSCTYDRVTPHGLFSGAQALVLFKSWTYS